MTANEAKELIGGQVVEWNDGRICLVQQNDFTTRQIRLQFGDGSVGIAGWMDLNQATLIESE